MSSLPNTQTRIGEALKITSFNSIVGFLATNSPISSMKQTPPSLMSVISQQFTELNNLDYYYSKRTNRQVIKESIQNVEEGIQAANKILEETKKLRRKGHKEEILVRENKVKIPSESSISEVESKIQELTERLELFKHKVNAEEFQPPSRKA